jgi:transposase
LIELLLPAPNAGGRPEKHPRRDIVDAILYVVRTGCACEPPSVSSTHAGGLHDLGTTF